MRRALIAVVALAIAGAPILIVRQERNASTQRVDVVFDTAKGMVAGQLVKVAGARAGHVDAVHLTPDHRARMQLRIEDRFLPFHADASCRILPEGPISENFVECDPGIDTARSLPRQQGVPTVPVRQTTAPVSVQDLLNVFAAPTQLRLRLLVNELGIGTAGRGKDIDDVLRRTNPALRQAQALLSVVNDQRDELGRAIDQTDRVLADLASGRRDVERFVGAAAATARTTGARRARLAAAVHRLPALLGATRNGLRSLDRATRAGLPVLDGLQRSGSQLTAVTRSLPAFAQAGVPAVRSATSAAVAGRRAIPSTGALAKSLRALGRTTPAVAALRDFMVASRDKGAIENLLRTAYALGNLTALYNGVSHVVTLFAGVQPQCLIPGVSAPGCDQRYSGPRTPLNAPANIVKTRAMLRRLLAQLDAPKARRPVMSGTRPAASPAARRPASAGGPLRPTAALPSEVQKAIDTVTGLLQPQPERDKSVTGLLDYLLG